MEVNALKEHYRLIAAGLSGESNNYQFVDIGRIKAIDFHYKYPVVIKKLISLIVRLFFLKKNTVENLFRYNLSQLSKLQFDLIIVHHFSDIELAVKLAETKNVKLVFNAHEYYPLEFDSDRDWMNSVHPKYMSIGQKYLGKMAICLCVGQEIAKRYKLEFGIDSKVITNAKRFMDLQPSPVGSGGRIRLVHHGNAMRSRKLELMITVVKLLGTNYSLDLILVPGEEDYIQELKTIYSGDSQINFRDPVSVQHIPEALNAYDIGIYILPPQNFNDQYALPNKFFEFIQARLAIAIAPSPEMKAIVENYDLGVVAEDFSPESLAAYIKNLSFEKIAYYKQQSHTHARVLSVEENERIITNTVQEILS